METQLTYDNKSRHLGIRFRERYTTREGLQAKVREDWRGKREKRNCKRPLFFRGKKKKTLSLSRPSPSPSNPLLSSLPPPKKKGHRRARHRHRRPRVPRSRREDTGPALARRQRAVEAQARRAREAAGGRRRLLLFAEGRAARARLRRGLPPPGRRAVDRRQGRAGARHEDAGRDGGREALTLEEPL